MTDADIVFDIIRSRLFSYYCFNNIDINSVYHHLVILNPSKTANSIKAKFDKLTKKSCFIHITKENKIFPNKYNVEKFYPIPCCINFKKSKNSSSISYNILTDKKEIFKYLYKI